MSDTLSDSDVERVTRRYMEIVGGGEFDRYGEVIAEDYVNHTRTGSIEGLEAFRGFMAGIFEAFPDIAWTILDTRVDGDRIIYHYEVAGTHRGETMGVAPTGRQVRFTGMEMNRIVDGKLAETWNYADLLSLMQQIGAIPTP